MGTIEEIQGHLKRGPAKNLINSFFNFKVNCCDFCGKVKSRTNQLDRAHCNLENCDRASLLRRAIECNFVNNETPLFVKDILNNFIKLHIDIPLFMLCKSCHISYDS